MPVFRYKAVSQPGEVLEGMMEATSQGAVIDSLRSQGLLPIRADENRSGTLHDWLHRELGRGGRVPRSEATLIIHELATLLRAGLPLDQALDVMVTYASKASHRALLRRILDSVRGGSSLADAFAAHREVFDRFCIGMVRAGEAGGSLDVVLAKTAEYLDRSQKTRQDLKSALVYPVILMITAFASVGIVVTVVIPSFQEIFEQAGYQLPLPTRIIMGIGSLAQSFWWVPLLAILGLVLYLGRLRRSPEGRRSLDARILRIPMLGALALKSEVSRLTYALGMLLSNGVPMLSALLVARDTLGNAALAAALDDVAREVKAGKTLAAPLERTGLFPSLSTRLLRIGEESGRLEDMLFKVAETYEQELARGIQRGLTLLVPALTVVIALIIAGIIISILVPMLSINDLVF